MSSGSVELRRHAQRFSDLFATRTGVIVLTNIGSTLMRTVSSVILTRLLSPEAFGVVGIIGAIFFVLTMLTDLGFQAFLVPHPRAEERRFRDVIWTIHAVRGVALAVLAAILSPVLAWVLGKPLLALPLAVTSVTFVFTGLTSFSLMTALRHHGARKLSVFDFILQAFQTLACLVLAFWWRSVWAMIAAMILQSALRMILSYTWFADSKHAITRDPAISREFMKFSRLIVATSIITLIILQTDKLVLARLFTLEQFGLYAIALSLASAPMVIGDAYATKVVFPVYAQIWRSTPAAIAGVYYSVRRSVSMLFALGCGALIGGAHLLVRILYDPRYEGSALWLSLLMIGVALRLPNVAASQLMTAQGDIRATFHVSIARLVWLVTAIPIGFLQFGPVGVVAVVGLVEVPAMLYTWVILHRVKVLDMREELLFVALIVLGTLLSYVASKTLLFLLGV